MTEKTVSVQVNITGKNMVVAYLLWWFLGFAGVHRFYLNRIPTGIMQLLLFLLGWALAIVYVGFAFLAIWGIWWLLDAFFVYRMVQKENKKLGINDPHFSVTKTNDAASDIEQLEKLHALYEKGAITKEQFEMKKSQLI